MKDTNKLCELLAQFLEDNQGSFLELLEDNEEFSSSIFTDTYENVGMLSMNDGFVLRFEDGTEFAFECVRRK